MPNKDHDPNAELIKSLKSGEPDLTGLTDEQKELEKQSLKLHTIVSKKSPGADIQRGLDISTYEKYIGAGKFNIEDMDFLNKERARKQGGGEQFGKTFVNTLANSVTGLAQDVGYLGSLVTETGSERDYTNALVEWAESLRNPAGEVYRVNPEETWDAGDSAWWFNHGGSLVESIIKFGAEGIATGGALGALGGAASGAVRGAAQGTKLMNAVLRGSKMAKATQKGLNVGAAALETSIPQVATSGLMSSLEASMEAAGTYKKISEKYKGILPEEKVKQMASEGASATFKLGATVNTLLNLTSVAPLFKDIRAVREMRKLGLKAGQKEGREAAGKRIGALNLEDKAVKEYTRGGNFAKSLALETGQEGLEETVTMWSGKAGERLGEKSQSGDLTAWEYLDQLGEFTSDVWNEEGGLNFFLGAIGGGGNKFISERAVPKKGFKLDKEGERIQALDKEGKAIEGEYEMERKNTAKRNREARERLFLKHKNTIIKEFDYIEEKQNKLKEIIEKGEDVVGASYEKTAAELFDLRQYQMITIGAGDVLANSFDEIAGLDNKTLLADGMREQIVALREQKAQISAQAEQEQREFSEEEIQATKEIDDNITKITEDIEVVGEKTDAMNKGYALKRDTDTYTDPFVDIALRAKESVLSSSELYDTLLKDFDYGEYGEYEVPNGILDVHLAKETANNSLEIYAKKLADFKAQVSEGLNEVGKEMLDVVLMKDVKRLKEGILNAAKAAKVKSSSDKILISNLEEEVKALDLKITQGEAEETLEFDIRQKDLTTYELVGKEIAEIGERQQEEVNLINSTIKEALEQGYDADAVITKLRARQRQVGKTEERLKFRSYLREGQETITRIKEKKAERERQAQRVSEIAKSLAASTSLEETLNLQKSKANADYEAMLTKKGREEYIERKKAEKRKIEVATQTKKEKDEDLKKKAAEIAEQESAKNTNKEKTLDNKKEYEKEKARKKREERKAEEKAETEAKVQTTEEVVEESETAKAVPTEEAPPKTKKGEVSPEVIEKRTVIIRDFATDVKDTTLKKFLNSLIGRIDKEQESEVLDLSEVLMNTVARVVSERGDVKTLMDAMDVEIKKFNIDSKRPLALTRDTRESVLNEMVESISESVSSLEADITTEAYSETADAPKSKRQQESEMFDNTVKKITKYIQIEGIYNDDIVKEHNNLVFSIRDTLKEAGELSAAVGNKDNAKDTLRKLMPYINLYFNARSTRFKNQGIDAQEIIFTDYTIDDSFNLVNNTADRLFEQQKKFEKFFNPEMIRGPEYETPDQRRKKESAITVANSGTAFDKIAREQIETATKATPLESRTVSIGDEITFEVQPDYDGVIGIHKDGEYGESNWKTALREFGGDVNWVIEHTPIAIYKGDELLGYVHDTSWVNEFNIAHETEKTVGNVAIQAAAIKALRKDLVKLENGKPIQSFYEGTVDSRGGGILNRHVDNKFVPIKGGEDVEERIPNMDTLNIPMLVIQTDGTLSNAEISEFSTGMEAKLQEAAGHVVLLFNKEGAKNLAFVQPSTVNGTYEGEQVGEDLTETVYEMLAAVLNKQERLSDEVSESPREALKGFVYTVPYESFLDRKRGTNKTTLTVTRDGVVRIGTQTDHINLDSTAKLEENKEKVMEWIGNLRHNASTKKLGNKDARAVLFREGKFVHEGSYDSFMHKRFLTDVVEKTYTDKKGNKESVFINNPVTGFKVNFKFDERTSTTGGNEGTGVKTTVVAGTKTAENVTEEIIKQREEEEDFLGFSLSADIKPSGYSATSKIVLSEDNKTKNNCK